MSDKMLKDAMRRIEDSVEVENLIDGMAEGKYFKEDYKDGSEKKYILLFYAIMDREEIKSFEIIVGRENTYNFIKNMIEYLDIHRSIVFTDCHTIEDAISVYDFMKHMINFFPDTSFDIEEYNIGDEFEELQ